jgi:chaperonin GroES
LLEKDHLSTVASLASRTRAIKPDKLERIAMNFRPLHDRVLIRRVEAKDKTTGGIIIPDTAQEKPMEGEIVAVGPGARNEKGEVVPLEVKAGNRILFGKWSGSEIKLDGEDLLIVSESDIIGVIESPAVAKKKAA